SIIYHIFAFCVSFFSHDTPPTEIYTLSLHDALPIYLVHASEAEKDYFEYLAHKEDLIMTGFKRFDEWMGGLGRGWLYVLAARPSDRKSTRLNSSHVKISYAVFCLKKKK